MRKYIGYIPAILFTASYALEGLSTAETMVYVWMILLWASALLLHKGLFWGGIFGALPAIEMIYTGARDKNDVLALSFGVVLLLFYCIFGLYLLKKQRTDPIQVENKEILFMAIKLVLTAATLFASGLVGIVSVLTLSTDGINGILTSVSLFVLPSLLLPLIWLKKGRKRFILVWLIPAVIYGIGLGVNYGIIHYNKSIKINTSPNINVYDYLPFDEDSKIVKKDSQTVKFTENMPRIDGAAALFPVYSAFVHATYPDTVKLSDGTFLYNNTPIGYRRLAEKETDIFIGVYPSEEQKAYAEDCGTTFVYTPIGTEAFVFFVHKDNPIESLTTEQIQGIYSGEISNWSEVSGKDEAIMAFQRNEGSGSQSMLERFMGDKPIMEAPKELRNDLMVGIIEEVSKYKNKSNSIGFSFRYYVEGIIKNPDIKMISVDGVAPAAENIKNGSYPIVTPIYAVTYEDNENENVGKLLDFILSEEGQTIIEETGYVGIN